MGSQTRSGFRDRAKWTFRHRRAPIYIAHAKWMFWLQTARAERSGGRQGQDIQNPL